MGSGVRAPGDAAVGNDLRDLDCAPYPDGGDEDGDNGGEKKLWVHVASLRLGGDRFRPGAFARRQPEGLSRQDRHVRQIPAVQVCRPCRECHRG